MNPTLEVRIVKHGEELKKFFGLPDEADPIKLCKQLRRIELTGNRAATDWCNGDITEGQYDIICNKLWKRIEKILLTKYFIPQIAIFFNSDPRGYFLKLKMDYSKDFYYKDWGGYGILVPDLN